MTLTLALCYGGREEIAAAARELAIEVAAGKLDPSDVDRRGARTRRMPSLGVGDPDLVIRTGGERRISNFLLYGARVRGARTSPTCSGPTSPRTTSTTPSRATSAASVASVSSASAAVTGAADRCADRRRDQTRAIDDVRAAANSNLAVRLADRRRRRAAHPRAPLQRPAVGLRLCFVASPRR